jgi:hypothetical protein
MEDRKPCVRCRGPKEPGKRRRLCARCRPPTCTAPGCTKTKLHGHGLCERHRYLKQKYGAAAFAGEPWRHGICQGCGEAFERERASRKYCTTACRNMFLNRKRHRDVVGRDRICTRCKVFQPGSAFWGSSAYCKPCDKQLRREQRQRLPRGVRDRKGTLARRGLTVARYEELVRAQHATCAICGTDTPGGHNGDGIWLVDHDHTCCPGRSGCAKCIRGLLCNHCNTGLGMFKDDSDLLRAAILYLERYRQMAS